MFIFPLFVWLIILFYSVYPSIIGRYIVLQNMAKFAHMFGSRLKYWYLPRCPVETLIHSTSRWNIDTFHVALLKHLYLPRCPVKTLINRTLFCKNTDAFHVLLLKYWYIPRCPVKTQIHSIWFWKNTDIFHFVHKKVYRSHIVL